MGGGSKKNTNHDYAVFEPDLQKVAIGGNNIPEIFRLCGNLPTYSHKIKWVNVNFHRLQDRFGSSSHRGNHAVKNTTKREAYV